MTLAINVVLLLLGIAAGILAFLGETIRRDQRGLRNRVTRLGWWALILMVATLALGIIKEFRNARLAAMAVAEAAKRERAASENAEKRENELNSQLKLTNAKLDSAEKLLGKVWDIIPGLPREIAHPYVETFRATDLRRVVVTYDGTPLRLFAGQLVKYYGAPSDMDLAFRIGDRRYPIHSSDGEVRVIGQWNDPMLFVLENPREARFGMKMAVVSSQNPDEIVAALRRLRDSGREREGSPEAPKSAATPDTESDAPSEEPQAAS